jgi:hypothetical protein
MSALSKLVSNPHPWLHFTDKYPVEVNQLNTPNTITDQIYKDIHEAGDAFQGKTPAKCLMTRWNMHEDYDTFRVIGEAAIEVAKSCPVSKRTKPDGSPDTIPLYIKESWGLRYGKDQTCEVHNHWPSLWSYTYCVSACKKCAPLVFVGSNERDDEGNPFHVYPKTGQLIVFPAWLNHAVPKQECEHSEHTRIMISGNLNMRENDRDRRNFIRGGP